MNHVQLEALRMIAAHMAGSAVQDWQWIGEYMSQRMFGITEERAKKYAKRHDGIAKQMEQTS